MHFARHRERDRGGSKVCLRTKVTQSSNEVKRDRDSNTDLYAERHQTKREICLLIIYVPFLRSYKYLQGYFLHAFIICQFDTCCLILQSQTMYKHAIDKNVIH